MKFTKCHPIVNFVFYMGTIIMGMCLTHPIFLLSSFVFSAIYYRMIKCDSLKQLKWLFIFFITITLVNPFFNSRGETVLFTWGSTRAYSMEALWYGATMGFIFVNTLLWLATYQKVICHDKLSYLLRKFSPTISFIVLMVFAMVPNYEKKIREISEARKLIGKSSENGTFREKIVFGMTLLSGLISWAFEEGMVTADSMKSRGYGCTERTSFTIYKKGKSDKIIISIMLFLMAAVFLCISYGGIEVRYFPVIYVTGADNLWMIFGFGCYSLFLSIPVVLQMKEEITWYILKSKI